MTIESMWINGVLQPDEVCGLYNSIKSKKDGLNGLRCGS